MIHKLSFKLAINGVLTISSVILVFHLLILMQIIPYTIVWGGKLKSFAQMVQFETVSILVNAFLISIIMIKGKYLKLNIPKQLMNGFIWLFVVLFTLNTVGNLFAKTSTETLVFTPLTFILALLCYRIAVEKKIEN